MSSVHFLKIPLFCDGPTPRALVAYKFPSSFGSFLTFQPVSSFAWGFVLGRGSRLFFYPFCFRPPECVCFFPFFPEKHSPKNTSQTFFLAFLSHLFLFVFLPMLIAGGCLHHLFFVLFFFPLSMFGQFLLFLFPLSLPRPPPPPVLFAGAFCLCFPFPSTFPDPDVLFCVYRRPPTT